MKGILPVFNDILCHPTTKAPLHLESGVWKDSHGNAFSVGDGIPDLRPASRPLRHRAWEWVYNLIAFGYDFGARTAWKYSFGGSPIRRESYADLIRASEGDRVLETAAGTGENLLRLIPNTHCIAVDQSRAMLKRFQQKLNQANLVAGLIQADIAALPLRDNLFDVVFHVGGLQFLSNPLPGIREMLRVARTGTMITIIDETASLNATIKRAGASSVRELVPPEGGLVDFGQISDGELYALQIRKESDPK